MGKARVRALGRLEGFTRSDWESVIQEAALGAEDTKIADMYLLDAIPQVEIGIELWLDRSTVSKRLHKIIDKVERTAEKLKLF